MSVILVPTDQPDIATAEGVANHLDTIKLEVSGSPFQGKNNRDIWIIAGDDYIIEGETGNPFDVVIDCQNVNSAFTIGFSSIALTLRDFTILDGDSVLGYGGALRGGSDISITIDNIVCDSCYASLAGGGMLIGPSTFPVRINNCLMFSCVTGGRGGGFGVWEANDVILRNCTITGCNASGGTAKGGGLLCGVGAGALTCIDTIIWGNTATNGGNDINIYGDVLTLDYCSHGNIGADILIEVGGSLVHTNDIHDTDPLFTTGDNGNYYLSQIAAGEGSDSSCLDAGSNTSINLGMDTYTTRTDNVIDTDQVDIGFHYSDAVEPGGILSGIFESAVFGKGIF